MKQVCPHTFISRKGSVLLNIFHKSFERLFTSMPASKIATARKCLLNKLSDSKALRISAPRRPFFSIDIAQNLSPKLDFAFGSILLIAAFNFSKSCSVISSNFEAPRGERIGGGMVENVQNPITRYYVGCRVEIFHKQFPHLRQI